MKSGKNPHGRGTGFNPPNRFEPFHLAGDIPEDSEWAEETGEQERKIPTTFFEDKTSTILNCNDSPDIGFEVSINPYRGCEHGCIYCYARPFHEYLGFSSGLDFESKILVKKAAPELLRKELNSPKWKPEFIAMSGVTDCYQPVEKRLELTRGCLKVLAEFRNPVGIVTKNRLVVRDIDILKSMAEWNGVVVFISLTTLKNEIWKVMEPRTASPTGRLETIHSLAAAGIPVGVMMAPIIPGLTDSEIPAVLSKAREAGASWAGYTFLRLPFQVKNLFEDWLDQFFPGHKEKVLKRIRTSRDGALNSSKFGERMRGNGWVADQVEKLFEITRRKLNFSTEKPLLDASMFRRRDLNQLELWDE